MSKKILITGGAGFTGHHLIEEVMRRTDWDVISLDRLDFSGNLNRIADIFERHQEWRSRIKIVWHDLKAALNDQVRHEIGEVNYIIHMAAASHVDRSIQYPMEFVMDNVVGTCNLLEYAKQLKTLDLLVYFSTDEVFGPAPEGVNYKEWDRYHCGNPYAATKAGAEELCLAFQNTYRMPITITHTMNIFGRRQDPEKFIPSTIRKVLENEEVTIHANAGKTEAGKRHYIYASDVADAMLFLIKLHEEGKTQVVGEKFNVVGERELDNLQLAQMIADHLGKPLKYRLVDFHSSRPGHDLRYALSGEKMGKLGWEPKLPVHERLKEVIDWTLENQEHWLFARKG